MFNEEVYHQYWGVAAFRVEMSGRSCYMTILLVTKRFVTRRIIIPVSERFFPWINYRIILGIEVEQH